MNGRDERPTTNEASPGCEVARRGRLIAVSGQADLGSFGRVPHPGDALAQVVAVVGRIRERIERVGADLSDLVKLVVFHVPGPGGGEREMRDLLARALGPDVLTTLTMVPLPRLVSPGLLIAVDAYAMRGADGRRIERAPLEVPGLASLPEPFCHGLRCDEFIFTSGQSALDERGEVLFGGDLPSQNRHALDGVAAVLDGLGAGPGDIVKFNTWRAPPPSPQGYRRAAQDRFDFLAAAPPAVTGITIPESTGPGPLIRMDAWAMRSNRCGPLPRWTLKPARHWDWPSPTPYSQGLRCGPWVFVGGQAALDERGKVVGVGTRADQTELVMRYVAQVLGAAGAGFDDVAKLNTYYCHRVGAGAWQDGTDPRSRCFSPPGPASSDVPVDELAYAGMLVEIEAIAAVRPRRDSPRLVHPSRAAGGPLAG